MLLDTGRLNAVVVEELHAFESDFDIQPVPRHQEIRAGTIAWIARFIPEAIPTDTGMAIAAANGRFHRHPEHRTYGWFRTLYLDAALFGLTGEERYLTYVLSNIDHHASSLREAVIGPLGLVADRLMADHPDLNGRIANSLSRGTMYNDALLGVFLATNGTAGFKKRQLDAWRRLPTLVPQDRERIDRLLSGLSLPLSFFCDEYARIQRHLLFRLGAPDLARRKASPSWPATPVAVADIEDRVDRHPLMASLLSPPSTANR
jgi:hypothetical protein